MKQISFSPTVRRRFLSGSCVLLIVMSALGGSLARAQSTVLVGSGSTVPAALYNRWGQEYARRTPGIKLRYVPIGTSEGIKQISHGTGDFGAGEAPLSEKERSEGDLIELPAVLISIVPIYNLPDLHSELRLSGDVLAQIYLGTLKTWNSPAIAKLNPDVDLPNTPIHVVQRPAGKGSNYVFTEFLSRASEKFRSQIGTTTSPKWTVGEPAERSSDMVDKIKTQPGSLGYVEYEYAVKSNVAQAAVLNAAGKYVRSSPQALMAACEAVEAPRWNRFSASLINAHAPEAFPITSFTWIYLRSGSSEMNRTAAMNEFLRWMYNEGQAFAGDEGYTALPQSLLAEVRKRLGEMH